MKKEKLLERIANLGYEMFERLKMKNEECRKENTFKLMRKARFYPLSEETLGSYIQDLENALIHSQNLLAVKYKCMELGPVSDEMVDKIAKIEVEWMKELRSKYPNIVKDKIEDFERYLRCELLTFSKYTLEKYYQDILSMKKMGINMAEASYLYLFKRIGYESLEEVGK